MKTVWLILVGLTCCAGSRLALAAEPRTLQSQSGQFLVRGLPYESLPGRGAILTNLSYVRLEPAVLTVSCERIKQALLEVLDLRDQWQGRVFIELHPAQQDREPVVVTSTRFADGWLYRVRMPDQMGRGRLLKVVVQVLLLEMGNRRAQAHSVELPPWLAEGLAAHLAATAAVTLALEPHTRVTRQEREQDPLRDVRQVLRAQTPLTLNELSWPTPEQLAEEQIALYRSCAQLFVHELLRLKHGRESLQEMLLVLPEYLNWQTAFLNSFREVFPRLSELDKWWALQVVHLAGRDVFSLWPPAETARQLEDILSTSVQVRLQTNDLPRAARFKLQNILQEWSFAQQLPVLLQKVNQLQALRLRTVPELAGLVDGYALALNDYLQSRDKPKRQGGTWSDAPINPGSAVNQAIRRLDDLDLKRERLLRQPARVEDAIASALAESLRRQPATSAPPVIAPTVRP